MYMQGTHAPYIEKQYAFTQAAKTCVFRTDRGFETLWQIQFCMFFQCLCCICQQPFYSPWGNYHFVPLQMHCLSLEMREESSWRSYNNCSFNFQWVSKLFFYSTPVPSVYTDNTKNLSVLKHLHICFILLGSDKLSAPTVHEVLGGNPSACCRFIINTHLRQPYQARQEYSNSFLCCSFLFIDSFEGHLIALYAFTKGN